MSKFRETQSAILAEAKKHYSDAQVLPKDHPDDTEDAVWRFVLVSADFGEDAPWDEELYLEVRQKLNQNNVLKSVADVFILVQPVSKTAFDRENGDIGKVTDREYQKTLTRDRKGALPGHETQI